MARSSIMSPDLNNALMGSVVACIAIFLLARGYKLFVRHLTLSTYPLYDDKRVTPIEELQASQDLMSRGFAKFPESTIWRINTTIGQVLVVSPKYLEKFRHGHGYSAAGWTEQEMPISTRGYEPFTFASNEWRQRTADIILHRLTSYVSKHKTELSEEVSNALGSRWTDATEWHEVSLFETLTAIIAQITQRFFTDTELCRNDAYIQSLFLYTTLAFTEGRGLMAWPRALHSVVARFDPASRKLRNAFEEVNRHLSPFVKKRRSEIETMRLQAERSGKQAPPADEWVAWLDERSQGENYSPTSAVVISSIASFHTTTDLMCQLLCDLARNPSLIERLKDEASRELKDHIWTKSSFSKLDLMDRCMKECQRMKPISAIILKSRALEDIIMDDGKRIPSGSLFCVSSHWMHDADIYPEPEVFDPDRHVKTSEESRPSKPKQFTAFSPESTGWGYGKHACPGRFFAAAVAKMLLTHILFKYEFRLPEGQLDQHDYQHATRFLIRRRNEDGGLNLDSFGSIDA